MKSNFLTRFWKKKEYFKIIKILLKRLRLLIILSRLRFFWSQKKFFKNPTKKLLRFIMSFNKEKMTF
jgi:hypothetical protein